MPEDPLAAGRPPRRIQRSRARGWRMPENTIYVGRPSRWANMFWPGQRVIVPGAWGSKASPYLGCRARGPYGPTGRTYRISVVRDLADAVDLFASYVHADPSGWPPEEIQASLGGYDLACWCPLDKPCHADVLLDLANLTSAGQASHSR
jgi:Domain of unknown function (DUF4326)